MLEAPSGFVVHISAFTSDLQLLKQLLLPFAGSQIAHLSFCGCKAAWRPPWYAMRLS